MHPDRRFNPTQTALLRHARRLIGLLIVVIGAAACSSPTPANAVEVPASPATTEAAVPSLMPEPLRTTADLDASDNAAVVLENLPIVPTDGNTLLQLAAPESAPSRWLLAHIDEPKIIAFSRSGSGNFDTLDVNGTSDTSLAEIERQLQVDGWTTRPSADAGLTASQGDTAAELTTVDIRVDGPDLDIAITAPTGMLDLEWAHEWWTQPLAGAGIDVTPTRMNVRWQRTGQCEDCTSTRLSVVVDGDDLDVNELPDRLAATRSGWTMTEDSGSVVVTSPDGLGMTISSELRELAVTIESQATTGAVTVEETEERSFGDYVC